MWDLSTGNIMSPFSKKPFAMTRTGSQGFELEHSMFRVNEDNTVLKIATPMSAIVITKVTNVIALPTNVTVMKTVQTMEMVSRPVLNRVRPVNVAILALVRYARRATTNVQYTINGAPMIGMTGQS
jgi:hypothetical protein